MWSSGVTAVLNKVHNLKIKQGLYFWHDYHYDIVSYKPCFDILENYNDNHAKKIPS